MTSQTWLLALTVGAILGVIGLGWFGPWWGRRTAPDRRLSKLPDAVRCKLGGLGHVISNRDVTVAVNAHKRQLATSKRRLHNVDAARLQRVRDEVQAAINAQVAERQREALQHRLGGE